MIKKIFLLTLVAFALGTGLSRADQGKLPEKLLYVVITSRNNIKWYKKLLYSIFSQEYENYKVVFTDDASTDGQADAVAGLVRALGQEHRFTLIRNQTRRGALENLYNMIHAAPHNAIVATWDGDDWAPHRKVFKKLNEVYSTQNVWLTHGRLVETESKASNWCETVPAHIIKKNEFRKFKCPSHLRTFYAWLFKKIKKEDLMFGGKFFEMTWDQAMMFPMIEMAGERHAFIDEINYVYNTTTQFSDNKVNAKLQNDLEAVIRAMKPYRRLENI